MEILGEIHKEALALCDRAIEMMEHGNHEEQTAHKLLEQAYEKFPNNAKINSWLGFSYGTTLDKVARGIDHCKRAVDSGEPDPYFFRNMGKLYLLQRNKKAAIGAFAKGLQIDKTNAPILREWKVLGFRRKPFLSFLSRDHFLNKNIGKLTWKYSKHNAKKRQ